MIYPPRAEHRVTEAKIGEFSPLDYLAQCKFNGTAVLIICIHGDIIIMNRHGKIYQIKITKDELRQIFPKCNNFVVCGEYMNKAQADETGSLLRDKFIIWDLISFGGDELIGKTVEERQHILFKNSKRGKRSSKPYLHKELTPNISIARVFESEFESAFKLSSIPMIEGIVIKRRNAPLKPFQRPDNNTDWQVKVRKPSKCYKF